jgi:hypothetical protein
MSGGHFDYNQTHIQYIIESIEDVIEKNGKKIEYENGDSPSEWDSGYYYEYPKDIIAEFKKGIYLMKQAYIYTQRIDYLLSGDDGENSFRKRLKEDLKEIEHLKPIQALWGGETGY